MKKIIILALIATTIFSCTKQKPQLKKPAPITYGDPRLNIIDSLGKN